MQIWNFQNSVFTLPRTKSKIGVIKLPSLKSLSQKLQERIDFEVDFWGTEIKVGARNDAMYCIPKKVPGS